MKRLTAMLICAAALFAGCPDKPEPNAPGNHEHHNHAGDNHTSHADNGADHGEEHTADKDANPGPEGMPSHGSMDEPEFRWDHLKAPTPDHAVIDLRNPKDPVSFQPVGDVTAEYKGYVVHFESAATKAKFEKKPLKFLNTLSLEPQMDGSVTLVDASKYQDAVTELCPFMPESEVDPHGTVYLLHRGWKFYFCCWTGCGDLFMQYPAAVYDYYGLVERDGKLVRKG